MMVMKSAVEIDINNETTDIYAWGVNKGNGDMQIEVWTFDTSQLRFFPHDNGLTIEVEGIMLGFQFKMHYGKRTLFDYAVVMD